MPLAHWSTWPPPAHPPRKPALRAATIAPLGVAALLFAAAAGFAATQVLRPAPPASAAAPDWQPYVDDAKRFTVDLTSLDYRDPDTGIQRILDGSTGSFRDDFASKSSDFRQTVVNSQVTTQGTVDAAALESISGTTAQVLLAATSTVTNSAGATQDPRHWRLVAQVEKIGAGFKVSKVEFVS